MIDKLILINPPCIGCFNAYYCYEDTFTRMDCEHIKRYVKEIIDRYEEKQ